MISYAVLFPSYCRSADCHSRFHLAPDPRQTQPITERMYCDDGNYAAISQEQKGSKPAEDGGI